MRSSTKFDTEITHGDDADFVRIFFTKQCHRTFFTSGFDRQQFRGDRRTFGDAFIDDIFDLTQFIRGQCLIMREVEAEGIIFNLRTTLSRILPHRAVQRVV